MKDWFMMIVVLVVTFNLVYSVNKLDKMMDELQLVDKVWSVQVPDHDEDAEVEEWENGYSDEQWTEVLGL